MQNRDFFEFIRSFEHDLGIYWTFTLDQSVVNKIREHSTGRTIILHDYRHYRHGINPSSDWKSRVKCIPFAVPLSKQQAKFHAKGALLRGTKSVRILLGSMNLAETSFSAPKELCSAVDAEYGSPLLNSVIEFLRSLKCYDETWADVLKEVSIGNVIPALHYDYSTIKHVSNRSGLPMVEAVLSDGLLEIFKRGSRTDNLVIRIASPFLSRHYNYSRFINLLKEKNLFPSEIHIHTRPEAPVGTSWLSCGVPVTVCYPRGRKHQAFHAKIVAFENGNSSLTYVGSANFTNQGFFKEPGNGGNAENGLLYYVENGKPDILSWFQEGWERNRIESLNQSQMDGSFAEDEAVRWYAYGERIEARTVRITLYLPNGLDQRKLKIEDQRVGILSLREDLFPDCFEVEYATIKNKLTVEVNGDKQSIEVFDLTAFQEARTVDGASLFVYHPKNLIDYSLRESAIYTAAQTRGIHVHSGGYDVVEPPVLEQLYKNIRERLNAIESKVIPFEAYYQEMFDELYENNEIIVKKDQWRIYRRSSGYVILKNSNVYHQFDECNKMDFLDRLRETKLPNAEKKIIKKLFEERGQRGGTGLYLIAQLSRVFNKKGKGWDRFRDVCMGSAKVISGADSSLPSLEIFESFVNKL
jgi:hypothetical protein